MQASGRAGGCHRVGAWTLGTLILCHTITLRPSKMPVRSSGHSSSRMASNVAPPRTGSWTSANGLAFSTAVRTSRRQFFDPKYPLDTKIWMTCEPSMYSSRASMETRSCAGAAPERASVASQEQLCQLGGRGAGKQQRELPLDGRALILSSAPDTASTGQRDRMSGHALAAARPSVRAGLRTG